METAIAAQEPSLKVLAPVREWHLKNLEDKLKYARRRRLPIEEPPEGPVVIDRNLWGVSLYFTTWPTPGSEPPASCFVLTRDAEDAPDEPATITLGFEAGVPVSLNGDTASN